MSERKTIWSATPTPFAHDGSLDHEALAQVVEQHLNLGVTGLFLAGTCGEGPFMPNQQRAELVEVTRRLAGNRLKLAVQVSDTSAARVSENMRCARDAGADFAVIAPPWLERFANHDFLHRYFLEPIENADIPVGIYVLKKPDESPLNVEFWTELAVHPSVQLVKDSSASDEYAQALGRIRQTRSDMLLLTGYEFDVLAAMEHGYDGALLGTGILIADFIRRAMNALDAGDREKAEQWQTRSNEFLWDLFGRDTRLWLGGLKYALVQMGIFNTEYMHLSFPLTDEDRTRIDAALKREQEFIR